MSNGNEFGPALTAAAAGLTDATTGAYDRSLLPSLINLGLSEGMSGRGMLQAFRAAGWSTSDASFYNAVRDVRMGNANVTKVQGLDLAQIPGSSDFAPWTGTHRSGYLYKFNVLFNRTNEASGETEQISRLWNYTSRVPLALGDVISDLVDIVNQTVDTTDSLGEEFVGLNLQNLYEMSP